MLVERRVGADDTKAPVTVAEGIRDRPGNRRVLIPLFPCLVGDVGDRRAHAEDGVQHQLDCPAPGADDLRTRSSSSALSDSRCLPPAVRREGRRKGSPAWAASAAVPWGRRIRAQAHALVAQAVRSHLLLPPRPEDVDRCLRGIMFSLFAGVREEWATARRLGCVPCALSSALRLRWPTGLATLYYY